MMFINGNLFQGYLMGFFHKSFNNLVHIEMNNSINAAFFSRRAELLHIFDIGLPYLMRILTRTITSISFIHATVETKCCLMIKINISN